MRDRRIHAINIIIVAHEHIMVEIYNLKDTLCWTIIFI